MSNDDLEIMPDTEAYLIKARFLVHEAWNKMQAACDLVDGIYQQAESDAQNPITSSAAMNAFLACSELKTRCDMARADLTSIELRMDI